MQPAPPFAFEEGTVCWCPAKDRREVNKETSLGQRLDLDLRHQNGSCWHLVRDELLVFLGANVAKNNDKAMQSKQQTLVRNRLHWGQIDSFTGLFCKLGMVPGCVCARVYHTRLTWAPKDGSLILTFEATPHSSQIFSPLCHGTWILKPNIGQILLKDQGPKHECFQVSSSQQMSAAIHGTSFFLFFGATFSNAKDSWQCWNSMCLTCEWLPTKTGIVQLLHVKWCI